MKANILNVSIREIRNTVLFFSLLGSVLAVSFSAMSQASNNLAKAEMSAIAIQPPVFRPSQSQASIDRAIAMFGIEIPFEAHYPEYDKNIEDRGRTIRNGRDKKATVKIGPAAFESWAVLGSTLAHELEVHCKQSFFMIQLLDMVGLKGTHIAERQAYNYEIENSRRFGLRDFEISNINETKYYFYSRQTNMVFQEKIDLFAEKVLFKKQH